MNQSLQAEYAPRHSYRATTGSVVFNGVPFDLVAARSRHSVAMCTSRLLVGSIQNCFARRGTQLVGAGAVNDGQQPDHFVKRSEKRQEQHRRFKSSISHTVAIGRSAHHTVYPRAGRRHGENEPLCGEAGGVFTVQYRTQHASRSSPSEFEHIFV